MAPPPHAPWLSYASARVHVQGADQKVCRREGTPQACLPAAPAPGTAMKNGGPREEKVKFSSRRSPVARAVRVLEFYVPSFGAAMLSGAPSADDACCSATALHGSGLSSGAAMAAATSAGVMRAHFGARYTWPRRCCAGCRTAAADHLLLETMGCAAVGRSFVMSSNSTEAWDAQEWVVTELQHHPCRLFHPYPLQYSGSYSFNQVYPSYRFWI